MNLRSQILVLIAIPLVALIGLGSVKGVNDWQRYQDAKATQASTVSSLKLITLVHYLQIERGRSAAYVSSGGKTFSTELPQTKALVDDAYADISIDVISEFLSLNRLESIRSEIQNQSITVSELAAFYTGTIAAILEEVSEDLLLQKNADLAQIGAGLVALSSAKESAGQQRAAGAGGLGAGTFSVPIFQKFVATGANETRLLAISKLTLDAHVPGLDHKASLEESGVQAARKAILAAGAGSEIQGLTGPEWFKMATKWITHLREVEDLVAQKMLQLAAAEEGSAFNAVVQTAVGVAISILCSVLIGLNLILSFTRQVKSLQGDLDRLSRKEFDFKPENLDRNNEIGSLSKSMEVTRLALEDAEKKLIAIDQNRAADRGAVVGVLDQHLSRLADRDLDCEIREVFPEEYETLRASFNSTVETLKQTISEVIASTDSINNGAEEISQAADDLSNRTESQAATLEETAAALEEMTVSVRSAAEGAKSVESAMQSARNEAERSGDVVQNAVSAMTEIEQSSSQISQIISVIDDIAFQTNLLALNAGVEAARAGEAGRGFAVVASEVRGLAQRSADAATEIKTLIEDSSKHVGNGVNLVGKAGDALANIVGRVNEISKLISEIASGAEEQATGLGEINTGVVQLDSVTQQNAAMVEQATAAGHMLHSDASKLAELVSGFSTGKQSKIQKIKPQSSASAHGSTDWNPSEPEPVELKTGSDDKWQSF